jgi:hypothetical protein
MKDSFDQHDAHRPRPSTVSRHAGQSCGKARSSALRNTPRIAPAARLRGVGIAMLSDAGMTLRYRSPSKMSLPGNNGANDLEVKDLEVEQLCLTGR